MFEGVIERAVSLFDTRYFYSGGDKLHKQVLMNLNRIFRLSSLAKLTLGQSGMGRQTFRARISIHAAIGN